MWAKGDFLKLALSGTQIKISRGVEVALKLCRETPRTKPPPCHELLFRTSGEHRDGFSFAHNHPACGQLLAAPKHPDQHTRPHTSSPTKRFVVAGSVSMLAMPQYGGLSKSSSEKNFVLGEIIAMASQQSTTVRLPANIINNCASSKCPKRSYQRRVKFKLDINHLYTIPPE